MAKKSDSFIDTLEKEIIFLLSHRKTIIASVIACLFFGLAVEGRLFQSMLIPALGVAFTMTLICLLYFIDYLAKKMARLAKENTELEGQLSEMHRVLHREKMQHPAKTGEATKNNPPIKLAG